MGWPANLNRASPHNHIHGDLPPTLLILGEGTTHHDGRQPRTRPPTGQLLGHRSRPAGGPSAGGHRRSHAWHYAAQPRLPADGGRSRRGRNPAPHRRHNGTLPGELADLPSRLVRPTAQTFKSYIDILGTPFPQDRPHAFLDWLADQLSVDLPRERFAAFGPATAPWRRCCRTSKRSMPISAWRASTSSGTSGRATIMVRDQAGTDTHRGELLPGLSALPGHARVRRPRHLCHAPPDAHRHGPHGQL